MITGTSACSASSRTVSSDPERITTPWTNRESIRAVSAIDSPRPSWSSSARSGMRMAAQLGNRHLERDPRARRRPLEVEGDAQPLERILLRPRGAPAPKLLRPLDQTQHLSG